MLTELGMGIILMFATSVVNLALGLFLIRTGRRTRSMPLEADGKHLLTDVYTSAGVAGGLILVRLTGWHGWDPLAACVVAVNIVFTGWRLLKKSLGRLMDEAEPELLGRIVEFLNVSRKPDWIDIHQLRARHYGDKVHVDFHLVVPRNMGLLEAHREAKQIEGMMLDSVTEVEEVIVHVDPCEDPFCGRCLKYQCQDRNKASPADRVPWQVEEVVMKRAQREEE